MRRSTLVGLVGVTLAALVGGTLAQANEMPIASTVPIEDEAVEAGAVVRYSETDDTFTVTKTPRDAQVYGVVNERPALVFVTATTAVPVVTGGVSDVLVSTENGPVARGDVLTSASRTGYAMRADLEDRAVFAIALEGTDADGLIEAEIGVEEARALQRERRADALEQTDDAGLIVSTARAALAAALVLGALGFVLYSFRSVMTSGVLSIGRNPRAKRSVMAATIGSMILAVILIAVVVFVAIGILVLPV